MSYFFDIDPAQCGLHHLQSGHCEEVLIMLPLISALLAFVADLFRSRASLCLENVALRHQLAIYKQTIGRPRLHTTDRLFWAWLSRLWSAWQDALAFVQPQTVIAWQRQRFRDHWRQLSHPGTPGRPAVADRKSTRLNSSHVKISYAVFCLKKKKKKKNNSYNKKKKKKKQKKKKQKKKT